MEVIITSLDNSIIAIPEAQSITLPTKEGVIGILPGHVPLVAALGSGVATIESLGKTDTIAISNGLIETDGKTVRILTDIAESSAEDVSVVRMRMEAARKAMEDARAQGDAISMDRFIEIEQEYQKDAAREQLAMGSHR